MAAKLKIVLTRSLIGRPNDQRDTARVLGLTKIHHSVLQEDTPAIRGMIRKVEHLVSVEEQKE
ncbi:MAG: 50S ribosomal protein L30 [Negativicutes bacterium]